MKTIKKFCALVVCALASPPIHGTTDVSGNGAANHQ